MASSEPAGLLPDKLPGLDDFVVSEVLNDGKDGGVVALLGTFKGCASPAVVKLSRPPVSTAPAAVTLAQRAPYSGMEYGYCLLYTSPSPRDQRGSRMPSSA